MGMSDRQVLLYFAWSRPGETQAPLSRIEDRFPALFELRRMFFPKFEALADPEAIDQGVAGFLDHVQKPNFAAFLAQAETLTGRPVRVVERVGDDGHRVLLDEATIGRADTVVVISFDSLRTKQRATPAEASAIRSFLERPEHLLFVCAHHDIGQADDLPADRRLDRQVVEYLHHGDHGIPPRQGFGTFARTLLEALGAPVDNRFGLRPAAAPDGSPAPIDVDAGADVLGLLEGVNTLNLHPHLPHFERLGPSTTRLDVLVRQPIDPAAPSHPFTANGRDTFDALLQSRPETFGGKLLVGDATLFSSTAGGLASLQRLWSNLLVRSAPS